MFESVHVIGAGRVGSAVAARLRERGVALARTTPELVLLCVPDSAIADVAALDRARPVDRARQRRDAARARSTRTRAASAFIRCRRSRAPRARAARRRLGRRHGGDATRRAAAGRGLAETLGLRPFDLDDARRVLYHAGAAIASNYLVTLHARRGRLLEAAGAPPEALVPLMRRTIDNGFELTGPIARGDWETVDAHVARDRTRPSRSSGRCTACSRRPTVALAMKVVRTIAELRERRSADAAARRSGSCRRWARSTTATSRCSRAARAECDTVVAEPLRQPGAVRRRATTSRATRATRRATPRSPRRRASTSSSRPAAEEMYPPGYQTWVDVEELSADPRGRAPARATSAASPPSA